MNEHPPLTFHHVPPRQEYYPVMNSFYAFYGEPAHPIHSTYVIPNISSDMNGGGDCFDGSTSHFSKRNYVKSNTSMSLRKDTNFIKQSFANHVPVRNPVMQQ